VRTERDQTAQVRGLRPESQNWVDASLSHKSRFDWREIVIRGMHYTGALNVARRVARSYEILPGSLLPWPRFRRAQTTRFVILCYHGIGESGNPLGLAPTREAFEAQMFFLRQHYRVVSLEEVCKGLRDPRTSEPGVAITFDDGYRSAYTVAFPILQKYHLPATIYVTLDCVESGEVAWYDRIFLAMAVAPSGEVQLDLDGPWRVELNSREDRLRAALELVAYLRALPNSRRRECCAVLEKRIGLPQNALSSRILTWEQIHLMHQAGIAFGSHTLTHPVVSQLTPTELANELGESRRLLEEKLGSPVADFAFPFGKESDCSAAAVEQLSRCGYRSAVTTVPGVNTPQANLFELRRLQVGDDGSLARFAFDLNQAFLRTEKPHSLNAVPIDLVAEQRDQSPKSIAGAFGGPDA
jgi:peptidoglycan/xylan/chitin deacetylase (PgdA/CDA1 family)